MTTKRSGKPKVMMLFCGGTIAMARDPKTNALQPALTPEQLYSMAPKIREHAKITVKYITDKDSSEMTSKDWHNITAAIRANQSKYDAFVVTHGTDTMVETANAIAYAFGKTLSKPVVITGSQCNPIELGSDATVNLERAVLTAISTNRPEVMISFHDTILRGTRAQKSSEKKLAAFTSPAIHPLGEHLGGVINWNEQQYSPPSKYGFDIMLNEARESPAHASKERFLPHFGEKVITVSLHAAQDAEHLHEALISRERENRVRGLVWTLLGAGNIPSALHPTIITCKNLGIPIVATSAFTGGKVNMREYAAGLKALQLGVISAGDMTPQAANVKLRWALGLAEHLKLERRRIIPFVRAVFSNNRAGEITLPKSRQLPELIHG